MYKIKIIYDTGNSFHKDYDVEKVLDLVVSNGDIAKANLKRIQEHYSYYLFMNQEWNASKKQKEEYFQKSRTKDWFNAAHGDFASQFNLYLFDDNGELFEQDAFWCGYFESLNSAEIIMDNSDWKITF